MSWEIGLSSSLVATSILALVLHEKKTREGESQTSYVARPKEGFELPPKVTDIAAKV
jgi:hypothetical protein